MKNIILLICFLGSLWVSAMQLERTDPKLLNYYEVVTKIEYPIESRQQGVEGKVVIALMIDEQGKVTGHQFKTYPCEKLKNAVEKVLNDFQFQPAKNEKTGKHIESNYLLQINFELNL